MQLGIEHQSSFDVNELEISLRPFTADSFKISEWRTQQALIILGGDSIVVVRVPKLAVASRIALEYEECEQVGFPYVMNDVRDDLAVIVTEFRVIIIDASLRIRWVWSTATEERRTMVLGRPTVQGDTLQLMVGVGVFTKRISLSIEDGHVVSSEVATS